MAIGDPYATPAELEIRLGRSDDGTFGPGLAGASRDIERYCGRQFNKTTVASARTYHPDTSHRVSVDDFHTLTDLVVATDPGGDGTFETAWTATDYVAEPRGGLMDGVTGWPYFRLEAVESLMFPTGTRRASVQVTAQWGWVTVPATVKEACLAAAEARLSKQPAPVVGESFDGYAVQFARVGSDSPFYPLARYRRIVPGLLVR